jgi:thiamine biosynthesis lipoprotein
MPSPVAAELLFPAMGTHVQLMACGVGPAALQAARRRVDDFESRWSRFLPTSEISTINANAGEWTPVSPDTFRLIEAAVTGWKMTEGRFDPTVLKALVAAGYDRSFELLDERDGAAPTLAPVPGCGAVQLDEDTSAIRVDPGVGLDLGGIAKGHTADLIVSALMADGATGALANIGGDVRAAGTAPVPPGWRIGAANPLDDSELGMFGLTDGAVVTSTRTRRHWTLGGVTAHHLIDPETGAPASSGLASVTVIASCAVWAEVLAKAAFVAGASGGGDLISRFGATGLFVHDSGAVTYLPGLGDFLL